MRVLHLLAAYWGFVLMSFHAGTHGSMALSRLRMDNKAIRWIVRALAAVVCIYGGCAFLRRGFAEYMFLKTVFVFFDTSRPFVFFYLDYLAVMLLFMTLGYLTMKAAGRKRR